MHELLSKEDYLLNIAVTHGTIGHSVLGIGYRIWINWVHIVGS